MNWVSEPLPVEPLAVEPGVRQVVFSKFQKHTSDAALLAVTLQWKAVWK